MKTPSITSPNNAQISLANAQATKSVNVSDMTSDERHELFINCMNQNGFIGFIKNKQNKETHYIFHYENYAKATPQTQR